MDKESRFPIQRYTSLESMRGDEYAYWRQQPAHERMKATAEITAEAYGIKNLPLDTLRLRRTLVRLQR